MDKHFDCLTFIFTKYNQEDKEIIHNQLKSVYRIETENGNKSTFTKLLNYLADYTEDEGA